LSALLTILNDPDRRGTLCFEEPENGVHEGRVPMLVEFLRNAATIPNDPVVPSFQILLATHSPKVLASLHDDEIVAAAVQCGLPAPDPLAKAAARQRSNVATLIATARDTCSTEELSGGNSLATIRSLYACPYRATFVFLRPQGSDPI
jgi:AAA domain, putative AbiEii toxin, Type IV TA system